MMHSFSGSSETLKHLLRLDVKIYFSFSMSVFASTHFSRLATPKTDLTNQSVVPGKKAMSKSLKMCPLDNLLLETDAPYQVNKGVFEVLKAIERAKQEKSQVELANDIRTWLNERAYSCYRVDEYLTAKVDREQAGIPNYDLNGLEGLCCESTVKYVNMPLYLNFQYLLVALYKQIPVDTLQNAIKQNFLGFCRFIIK